VGQGAALHPVRQTIPGHHEEAKGWALMTPEDGTKGAPAARLTIEYRPKPSCKRCGGRGFNGYHTSLVADKDGNKSWQRGAPARCSCCREVRREVVENGNGINVKETPAE
jgi:hypothetical protein